LIMWWWVRHGHILVMIVVIDGLFHSHNNEPSGPGNIFWAAETLSYYQKGFYSLELALGLTVIVWRARAESIRQCKVQLSRCSSGRQANDRCQLLGISSGTLESESWKNTDEFRNQLKFFQLNLHLSILIIISSVLPTSDEKVLGQCDVQHYTCRLLKGTLVNLLRSGTVE
jgi:hypothetical protein